MMPKPLPKALDPETRLKFTCACVSVAMLLAPLPFCFAYYQLTGTQASFGAAALATVIAMAFTLVCAWHIKPGRLAQKTLGFIEFIGPSLYDFASITRRIATLLD